MITSDDVMRAIDRVLYLGSDVKEVEIHVGYQAYRDLLVHCGRTVDENAHHRFCGHRVVLKSDCPPSGLFVIPK